VFYADPQKYCALYRDHNIAPYHESVRQESVAEQRSDHLTVEEPQQTVQVSVEENIQFGSARISKLPENSELLRFEFSVPKDIFWQYISDHLVKDDDDEDDDQFWINGVMNQ